MIVCGGRRHRADHMHHPIAPPLTYLAAFDVGTAVFVAETKIAKVWKVMRRNGQAAALKVYHCDDMAAERHGFDFIENLNGAGVARIYRRDTGAALLEWLDGPSLGDLTRRGHDLEANTELVAVANRLHMAEHHRAMNLPHLEDWFCALFDLGFGTECPRDGIEDINRCKALARKLLADQRDVRPLHGDLHHDNVRLGPRGYCAFDAKGVLGERAYELANAFRNPTGADAIVRDPTRARSLVSFWSTSFAVDPERLMSWAAVKCALSIAWRCGRTLHHDNELDLLHGFLRLLDQMAQ
jgi:streptomycin 6-kinase